MNNKLYTIVAGAVIVLIGGYLLLKGQVNNPAPVQNQPQINQPTQVVSEASPTATIEAGQNVVKYTDNGFEPNSLTVKVGTSVTFVNNSSSPMWVASNPHPIHNGLPGFDELASTDKGGSYQYTFTKAGSWGFHNHMSPSDTGVVIVQ